MSTATSSTLSVRRTIPELVRVYESAAADIRAAFQSIADAERRLNATYTMENACDIRVRGRYSHHTMDWDDPSGAIELLKRDAWRALVERLELRRMLSVQRAKELDEQLERGELPEITEQSVFAFAQFYSDHIDDMMGEAVSEVFEFLRPRKNEYKTNSQLEIGPRVILARAVETGWIKGFRVHHHRSQQFQAMESVFAALDGKGAVSKTHYSALENAIKAAPVGETPYFAYRCCKNGNLHLQFRRPDLLQRLNQIAGGRRLRPAAERVA
jgi:Domain of unknown function (DUF4942)